jgi:ATP-dependent exoDNAse (exonuclease V) beta subunit
MSVKNLDIRKASAGSGKTYTLALRYVELLLGTCIDNSTPSWCWKPDKAKQPNRHSHILAVTFTNKATDEMKRRIVRELALLARVPLMAGVKDSPYRDTLMSEFGISAAELQEFAEKVLKELLFNFSNFNVSTIDSFFQSVLRTFAYEVELSGNYNLSLSKEELLGFAVDNVMHKARTDSTLGKWLQSWMDSLIESGNQFNVLNSRGKTRQSLIKFVDDLTDEDFQLSEIKLPTVAEVQALDEALTAKIAELKQNIIRIANDYYSTSKDLPFKDIVNLGVIREQLTAAQEKLISEDTNGLDVIYPVYLSLLQMKKQIYSYGLMGAIMQEASDLKKLNNEILISDTSALLHQIIDGSDTPFIYERLGQRLQHFLIDEFQDTSGMQWSNFRPLLEESLGYNNSNLIIGDVKQCIYRFRGSKPSLLDSEVEKQLSEHSQLTPMDTNYRSAKEIVEFNNELFEKISTHLSSENIEKVYSGVAQNVHRKDVPGYVKLLWSARPDAMDILVVDIRNQLQRGYKPSDILILVRSNDQAKEVVEFVQSLKHPGFNIISDESLAIGASDTVKAIVAALRLLAPKPQAETAANDYYKYTPNDVYSISTLLSELCAQSAGADDQQRFDLLTQAIDTIKNKPVNANLPTDRTSLYQLVHRLASSIVANASGMNDVYVSAFFDLVLDYTQRNPDDIASFLEYWDTIGCTQTIQSAPSIQAVRVMTIHKAKGLEAPCVHLPLLSSQLGKEEGTAWYETKDLGRALAKCEHYVVKDPEAAETPELKLPKHYPINSTKSGLFGTCFFPEYESRLSDAMLDELNTIYVAFTRAERELFVNCSVTRSTDITGLHLLIFDAANEIEDQVENEMEYPHLEDPEAEPIIATCWESGKATHPKASEKSVKPEEPLPDTLNLHFGEGRRDIFEKLTVSDEEPSTLGD